MALRQYAWWKFGGVWLLFLALHFSYAAFPSTLFQLIGEQSETTFSHMKMLFVAYLAASAVEFVLRRKDRGHTRNFLSARALIAVAYPWLTITIWFSAEALGVKMPGLLVELVYANLVTMLGIYLALQLEQLLEGVAFRSAVTVMIALVFACAALSYTSFSFKTPLPFFTPPPGF